MLRRDYSIPKVITASAATALIGVLPTYATIGVAAPIFLLVLRVLQGLALGGEYGGAAVYVAEHVPDSSRGFYTSFIQITATLGLFVSLAVILVVQNTMSEATFREWGWRVPFLISIVLVLVSLYIRLKMQESPIFTHIKSAGMTSARPLPYDIGNGVFGGLLPLIGLYVVSATGNIYAGLYYPIAVAFITFVVGSLLLKETRNVKIWDELR